MQFNDRGSRDGDFFGQRHYSRDHYEWGCNGSSLRRQFCGFSVSNGDSAGGDHNFLICLAWFVRLSTISPSQTPPASGAWRSGSASKHSFTTENEGRFLHSGNCTLRLGDRRVDSCTEVPLGGDCLGRHCPVYPDWLSKAACPDSTPEATANDPIAVIGQIKIYRQSRTLLEHHPHIQSPPNFRIYLVCMLIAIIPNDGTTTALRRPRSSL